MKRSVYSLVLMDDVVKAVDEEAYRLGTSRSNLINQIVAEHLSCITPEMRMREIFNSVTEFASSSFKIQQQQSVSLMNLKTVLEYKYRPAVNYKVELEREPNNFLGRMRIYIRTRNQLLISMFNNFFIYRIDFEKKCLSELGYNDYEFELYSGSFTRKLINGAFDSKKTGTAISMYLAHINKALQLYFSSPESFPSHMIENEYRQFLEQFII